MPMQKSCKVVKDDAEKTPLAREDFLTKPPNAKYLIGSLGLDKYAKKQSIPMFIVGEEHVLVPYHQVHDNLLKMLKVIQCEDVWPHVDGPNVLDYKYVLSMHADYINQAKRFEDGHPYQVDGFNIAWLLMDHYGNCIGWAAFHSDDWEGFVIDNLQTRYITEFAFAMLPDHQSHGMGKEMAGILTDWFIENIGAEIYYSAYDYNVRSIKIAESIGFEALVVNQTQNKEGEHLFNTPQKQHEFDWHGKRMVSFIKRPKNVMQ